MPNAWASTGNGKALYGESGTGVLRTQNYDNDTSAWGGEGDATTTSTVVSWVVIKPSPVSGDYLAASYSNTGNDTLYISRWNDSTSGWELEKTDTTIADTVTFRRFDVAFEQDSGNALVVFSNGGTTNELSYYYYLADTDTWIGACTINSNRTTKAVEWVRLAASPSSVNTNEVALAFSDANDDLNAFIWTPATTNPANCTDLAGWWGDEPTSLLEGSLATTNTFKFDIAYEETSGDVLLAWYPSTTDLDYTTNLGDGTGWASPTTDTNFADDRVELQLCSEPSANRIGLASLTNSATSADTETAIWTGSAWGNISTALDAVAELNASNQDIDCGFVGTSGNMVVVYNDEETSDNQLDWILWNGSTWAVQTDVSYGTTIAQERHLHVDNFPGEDKIMVTMTNSVSDLWTFKYDGSSMTVLSAAALEPTLSIATLGCADVALSAFDPTPVADVTNLVAQRDGDATTIAFDTQNEPRVKGFHVARAEVVGGQVGESARMTPDLIKARGRNLSGASYSVHDTSALPGHEYVYTLEVIGRGGDKVVQTVGPIAPDLGGRLTRVDPTTGETTVARQDTPVETAIHLTRAGAPVTLGETDDGLGEVSAHPKAQAAQRALPRTRKHGKASKPKTVPGSKGTGSLLQHVPAVPGTNVKLTVTEPGIYRVTGQELQDAGWDVTAVPPELLSLTAQETAVPIRLVGMADGRFDPEDSFEFWGEPVETRYYGHNIYWLTQQAGGARMMETVADKGGATPLSYDALARQEGDEIYFAESTSDAHWFFDYELWAYGGPDMFDVAVPVEHLKHVGGKAELVVGLQGMSTWGFLDAGHRRQHAIFYWNGTQIGEHEWEGDTYAEVALRVPLRLIEDGENWLTIEATDEGDGILEQFFLVDRVAFTYPRAFIAGADGLVFPAERKGPATYKVRQFPAEEALAYVKHDEETVEYVTGLQVLHESDGVTVVFKDDGKPKHKPSSGKPGKDAAHHDCAIIPPAAIRSVERVALDAPSELKDGPARPYVVIAPAEFHETLAAFAEHRGALLVDVEDVYDEFSDGLPDPRAIRDYLVGAAARGTTMALLVGDGHFDYRDFQGSGVPEYVPVALVQNPYRGATWDTYGEAPWDSWFGVAEDESLPRLAVGRWPVRTTADLDAVIAKTLAYEAASSHARSVFLADGEPIFHATEDRLIGLLAHPDEAVKLYNDVLDPATTKARFLEELNRGVDLASYAGHGAIHLWSPDRLFTVDDIASLTNADHYPVLLTLGCLSGYFVYPTGLDCLAERLLTAPDKGIVATLSPTWLSSTSEQQVFGSAWLTALVDGNTLGEALLAAQRAAFDQLPSGTATGVVHSFGLLGDPALRLHLD